MKRFGLYFLMIMLLGMWVIAEDSSEKAENDQSDDHDWQFTEKWVVEFGEEEWFEKNDITLGMTANPRTGNILVADGNKSRVIILDGSSGEKIGTLPEPEDGFTGGLLMVSQVIAAPSGTIAVCNFTADASEAPFKIYLYENEEDTEPEILVHQTEEPKRLGDTLAITEDLYGNVRLIAAAITPGDIIQANYARGYWEVKEPEVDGNPAFHSVTMLPDGSFYVHELWGRYEQIDRYGAMIMEGAIKLPPQAIISNLYVDIEGDHYLASAPVQGSEFDGHDYIAIYDDREGEKVGRADISELSNLNENRLRAGDVSLFPYSYDGGDPKLYVAAMATNNYLGVWEVEAPIEVEEVPRQ